VQRRHVDEERPVSRPGIRIRGRVAVVALAAALAVTPLISACGTTQAGAAAIVGDRRITVDEVQTATEQLKGLVQDPSQITQQLVLGWLIANPYAVQVAGEQGKGVSRNDALNFFEQAHFTNSGGGTTPSEAAISAVQSAYALQLLTGQTADPQTAKKAVDEILADLKAAKVSVNPRYGAFDYAWDDQTQSFTLSPRNEAWLATPRPTASQPATQPSPGSS
jgi:hypothetical protein